MATGGKLCLCYNKGCGKSFDPNENKKDSCTYHPGTPVFHDAYKGWSCCKSKSTDFTEFLNFKGCATSYHNNVKPEEPKKKVIDKSKTAEVFKFQAPRRCVYVDDVPRPPFDTPLTTITPSVSDVLRQQVAACLESAVDSTKPSEDKGDVPIGTPCTNAGCKESYGGPESSKRKCIYHPGCPVFHEGMKYWTCCTKRTSDFKTFLEQVGCSFGPHVWIKAETGSSTNCRLDWHQTGSSVVISIFAKNYDPDRSCVQLSPVRVKVSLVFLDHSATYENDIELFAVVKVEGSSVNMLPTKVEINLKKSLGARWPDLDLKRIRLQRLHEEGQVERTDVTSRDQDDDVDLSDL